MTRRSITRNYELPYQFSSSQEIMRDVIVLKRFTIGLSCKVAYCATMQALEPFALQVFE